MRTEPSSGERKQLEELCEENFGIVRRNYRNPPVSGPELIWEKIKESGLGTAFLDWMKRRAGINIPFAQELAGDGDLAEIIRGLTTHELGHWIFHPYNLTMSLFLSYNAEKIFKEKAEAIYPLFVDYCDNALVVDNDVNAEDLKKTLRAGWEALQDKCPAMAAQFLAYAQRIELWYDENREDYSEETQEKTEEAIEAIGEKCKTLKDKVHFLMRIKPTEIEDYEKTKRAKIKTALAAIKADGIPIQAEEYDEETWKQIQAAAKELISVGESIKQVDMHAKGNMQYQYAQLIRFGDALRPLIKEDQRLEYILGTGGDQILTKELIDSLPADAKREIEEAIRKMITQLPKGLYEKIKKHFLGEGKTEPTSAAQGIGLGGEEAQTADRDTVNYYRDAAKQYGIHIRQRRTLTISSQNIPFGKKDFKPQDGLGIDPRFSAGKILPGLTKAERREKIPYPATKDRIPNLILYKDASGSMLDPRGSQKCYGTVAGAMYALSYCKSHAEVGVVLFDSESTEVFRSHDEIELLTVLCGHKGGGTAVDMERLRADLKGKDYRIPLDRDLDIREIANNPLFKKYLLKEAKVRNPGKTEQLTDFVIITDGGIMNVQELVQFFGENPEYRPTILHSGGFPLEVPGYDQETSGTYSGIQIWKADRQEDLIGIAKKSINTNLMTPWYDAK